MPLKSNSSNFFFNIIIMEKICFIRLEASWKRRRSCCIFKSALPLVLDVYTIGMDCTKWDHLPVFDTLKLKGRKAHLEGAEALMANAGTFSKIPRSISS
jgi:hypothetical protein